MMGITYWPRADSLQALAALLLLLLLPPPPLPLPPVFSPSRHGVVAAAAAAAASHGPGASRRFCSSSAPLRTPHVATFFESHAELRRGCVSKERVAGGVAVHVVRIRTDTKGVLLTVTGDEGTTVVIFFLQGQ